MSTYFLLSFGLISFLLLVSFLSCSSILLPMNAASYTSSMINKNDNIKYDNNEQDIPISDARERRAYAFYPRSNRNTWFRVSTYQHFKPSGPEDTPNGDNLMRWG